jgi:long-subunit acyl-CoA synthetase (AMP-forming)
VGCPVPVVDIQIRDELGVVVPDAMVGELWVQSPNVVMGYWN